MPNSYPVTGEWRHGWDYPEREGSYLSTGPWGDLDFKYFSVYDDGSKGWDNIDSEDEHKHMWAELNRPTEEQWKNNDRR